MNILNYRINIAIGTLQQAQIHLDRQGLHYHNSQQLQNFIFIDIKQLIVEYFTQ